MNEDEKLLLFSAIVWNGGKWVSQSVWSQVLAAQEFSGQFFELETFL